MRGRVASPGLGSLTVFISLTLQYQASSGAVP